MNYTIVDATPSLACREMDAAGEKFREDVHFGGSSVIPPIRLHTSCLGNDDCKGTNPDGEKDTILHVCRIHK